MSAPAPDLHADDAWRGDPRAVRERVRAGTHTGHTAGLAPCHVQGNLCILPAAYAADFAAYCQRNPRPCPLVGMSATGDPRVPDLAEDLDLRTDVPRYRVFENGRLVDRPTDIRDRWRDDLVAFVLGCSFSFEQALLDAGIGLRHVAHGENVAMYRTSLRTVPAGLFRGPMVVSMRPLAPAAAIRAIRITSRYPGVHGAPVHLGFPEQIGIANLTAPDFGDPPRIEPGELPVFWACGVTPQVAIEAARPELCITHDPGCMVVTDRLNAEMAVY